MQTAMLRVRVHQHGYRQFESRPLADFGASVDCKIARCKEEWSKQLTRIYPRQIVLDAFWIMAQKRSNVRVCDDSENHQLAHKTLEVLSMVCLLRRFDNDQLKRLSYILRIGDKLRTKCTSLLRRFRSCVAKLSLPNCTSMWPLIVTILASAFFVRISSTCSAEMLNNSSRFNLPFCVWKVLLIKKKAFCRAIQISVAQCKYSSFENVLDLYKAQRANPFHDFSKSWLTDTPDILILLNHFSDQCWNEAAALGRGNLRDLKSRQKLHLWCLCALELFSIQRTTPYHVHSVISITRTMQSSSWLFLMLSQNRSCSMTNSCKILPAKVDVTNHNASTTSNGPFSSVIRRCFLILPP